MIDYQNINNVSGVNAGEDDIVFEVKFDSHTTVLSLDENGNFIIENNITNNDKRILQLVMKCLLSNNIIKYANKVNIGEITELTLIL